MNESSTGALACIVIIVFILSLYALNRWQKRQAIQRALKDYEAALLELKRTPTDSDIRQITLEFGREYAKLLRDNKQATVFDEVALMNDLNAIGGGHVVSDTLGKKPMDRGVEERLGTLEDLRSKKLISEEEYRKRREDILNQI